jgi:hypothetical protein
VRSLKPRRLRTDRTCKSKRRYSDEPEARAAGMVSLAERPGQERLFVYLCPHCDGWHLTKSSQGRRAMVTADNPVPVQ